MRYTRILLVALLFISGCSLLPEKSEIKAPQLQRYDVLAAAKYQDAAYKAIPAKGVPCVLLKSFGNVNPFIKKVVSKNKFNAIFIHGIWRDNHVFGAKETKLAVKQARRLQTKYANKGKDIYFSPFLENRVPVKRMTKVFKKIRAVAPDLILVNSYLAGGGHVKGTIPEVHHSKKPNGVSKYIFSTDGEDALNINIAKEVSDHSDALMFGMWVPEFNLKKSLHDSTPRPDRKYIPSEKLIKSVEFLFTEKGATAWPNKWLHKSHAENANVGNPRNNKPLFIIPVNKSSVVVKDKNGSKVATFNTTGQYHDGRYVYRHTNSYAYELAEKAISQSGSPACFVEGKKYNCGFREGEYK